MLTFILIIFLCIGVSIINGSTCACCFPWQTQDCQVPAIYISCEDCTSFFCANHVKGCQGSPPCKAVCIPDSSSTTTTVRSSSYPSTEPITTMISSTSSMEPITTMISSTSSMEPITNTTTNSGGYFIRIELFVISASLTLLTLGQLNL